ncbi:nitrilase-related carbon-nitrogen hydrolase [Acetivibrio straminisolvens]|uniref:Hydrolase n=1 Tax=Acetivibrio straminisolvens JCM 21531 TaxID=1294263 RepID=W4V2C1_9FIRM|nr:nitrilase-related carbon-nitrogen hydrolase [Acetivibrio straminisolvens]GAE87620.1 hydrolase [Acetivibrio straminisolvens JCM 21531]
MRVALYQMEIAWEDKEKNYKKLEGVLEEVKKHGTDLLLLPEMSFTGFSMRTELTKEYNEESKDRIKKDLRKPSNLHWFRLGKSFRRKSRKPLHNNQRKR